jgi:hypothetical protein
MPNFDDLKRQAEQHFGKDVVRRVERELERQSDSRRDLVDVGNVNFGGERKKEGSGFKNYAQKDAEATKHSQEEPRTDAESRQSNASQPSVDSHAARLVAQSIKWEYIYGVVGLSLGLASILGGIILGLHGVAGSTSWTAKFLALESKVNDSTPGVVLFIVGLFMVYVTKPTVRLKNLIG